MTSPVLAWGCADLIGIADLPGPPSSEAGLDGGGDVIGQNEASLDAGTVDARKDSDGGGDSGPIALSITPFGLHLVRGTTDSIMVEVTGFSSGAAAIDVTGLPSGVSAAPLTITAPAKSGSLKLTAAASALLGAAKVSVATKTAATGLDLVVADPTGTYNQTFGTAGGVVVDAPLGDTSQAAKSLVILEDESCVVAGSGWTLVHVLLNGTIDMSYPTASLPSTGSISALALGPSTGPLAGTLLATGSSEECDSGASNEATVYVLTKTGAPFTALNGSGYWCVNYESYPGGTTGIGVGASALGDISVGFTSSTGSSYIQRFSYQGTAPSTGWTNATIEAKASLVGFFIDPSGNCITAGGYDGNDFYARRYLLSGGGSPESTFGGDGGAFGASNTLYAQASALDPDGGVWVGGSGTASGQTPVLGHVSAKGAVDLGGDAGYVKDNFYVQDSIGYLALASQSDGRLLGIGNGEDTMGNLPFIARVLATGGLDPTFNADGGSSAGYYLRTSTTGIVYGAVAAMPFPDGRIIIAGNEPSFGMYFLRIWP